MVNVGDLVEIRSKRDMIGSRFRKPREPLVNFFAKVCKVDKYHFLCRNLNVGTSTVIFIPKDPYYTFRVLNKKEQDTVTILYEK